MPPRHDHWATAQHLALAELENIRVRSLKVGWAQSPVKFPNQRSQFV
ncbi:hypothetical protein C7S17_5102 [Burkholderia thailandensis]|nr:hypothetical protein [Burkholderia thailandensis]